MSTTKKDTNWLAVPLLAAGAVILAGAAGSASAAGQEPAHNGTDGLGIAMTSQPVLTLRHAMIRAGEDQVFSAELLGNPEKFKSEYNLSDSQVKALKDSQEAVNISGTNKWNYQG